MIREDAEKKLAALRAKEAQRDDMWKIVTRLVSEACDISDRIKDLSKQLSQVESQQSSARLDYARVRAEADALRAEFLDAVAEEAQR